MSPLPEIKGPDREKPLCYDPERDKFIYFDELIQRKEKTIPLEKLTHEQRVKLVVERNRKGPDYSVQVLSGMKYSRDDVIREIIEETAFGKSAVEAELSHVSELLRQIEENL